MKKVTNGDEGEVVDLKKSKPTRLNVMVVVVLETTEGNSIHIELLHPVETQVDEHTLQITGTSYK
jgi:hypothetical protein